MKASIKSHMSKAAIYILLFVISIITLYPFIHVFMYSLSDSKEAMSGGLFLWPRKITVTAFERVMATGMIFTSYKNSIYVTSVGTFLSVLFTILIAYPLSIRRFRWRKVIASMIYFTMLFSGGMIPQYILVKSLGFIDSRWSLILPGMLSAYNIFILRNFFQNIPPSLEESANIDGASQFTTLFRIILPLSLPALAVQALFYGVGYWNAFFNCILYINDASLQVLQVYIRSLMNATAFGGASDIVDMSSDSVLTEETMKMAAISVSVIPIMLVYPWLQKYYVKGVVVGAVKG